MPSCLKVMSSQPTFSNITLNSNVDRTTKYVCAPLPLSSHCTTTSETPRHKCAGVLIGFPSILFSFRVQTLHSLGPSQTAHPQAEPHAPVAPTLSSDRPVLRLILMAPTESLCPLHPHSAQT